MKRIAGLAVILLLILSFVTMSALAAEATDGMLYRGIKGHQEEVEFLQYQLFYAGYLGDDIREVDGIFGKKTEDALKAYQQDRGFTPDGILWPDVKAQLDEEWENSMENQGGEEDPYPYCYTDYYADGIDYLVPCGMHMQTYEKAAQALDQAQSDDMQTIAALKSNIQLWLSELDEQYQLRMDLCDEAYKPLWMNHKESFMNYYEAQLAIWNARYGEDSMAALELACTMVADHCVEMCSRMSQGL